MPQRYDDRRREAVDLEVEISVDRDARELRPLVVEAAAAATVRGLLAQALRNTFTLTANGHELMRDASDANRLPEP